MKGTIARLMQAIANMFKGTWKAVVHGGKVTMKWVRETAAPAIWDVACEAGDACVRTAKETVHAVPNLLGRLTGSGAAVAPAPASGASAPLDVQQADRQAVLDAANNDDRRRGLAIAVRAGARALLRDQTPVGVPEPVALWMKSLGPEKLSMVAAMTPERILEALDGKPTALGDGYHAQAWEGAPAPAPAPQAVPVREPEVATPIVQMKDALEARARERLQRRLKGMGEPLPGETLEPIAVRL